MTNETDIARNMITQFQAFNLYNFLETLAEDGKINMTAEHIANAAEPVIGKRPTEVTVKRCCRDKGISYRVRQESPGGIDGLISHTTRIESDLADLVDAVSIHLERLNLHSKLGNQLESKVDALITRVDALEIKWGPDGGNIKFPEVNGGGK